MFAQSTLFLVLRHVFTFRKREKPGIYVLGGVWPRQYMFFLTCRSLSGSNTSPARACQGAHIMETCCSIYEQSRHALDFEWHRVYIIAAMADT